MRFSNTLLHISALILCLFIQTSYTQSYYAQYPDSVKNYMATRQMRYHHYMWHQVRANWNKFSSSTKNDFKNIGWQPPNPSRDSQGRTITNNFAGEDFLYMHRNMIQIARQAASSHGDSTASITSWVTIPAPGDSTYPVPPAFKMGSVSNYFAEYKTNSYYQGMKNEEQQLKNSSVLKKLTLNQLGIRIEGYIHTSLHYRWTSSSSVGYRSGGIVTTQTPNINKQWDDPRYDWMGDSYASHVNPLFWKLHGWIDDRIEDWRKANGLSSVRWSGTWVGGPVTNLGSVVNKMVGGMHDMNMSSGAKADPEAVGEVLEQAVQIFLKSGVPEVNLGDPLGQV